MGTRWGWLIRSGAPTCRLRNGGTFRTFRRAPGTSRASLLRPPLQVLTTGPDLGQGRSENQKDYISYLEIPLDPALFNLCCHRSATMHR